MTNLLDLEAFSHRSWTFAFFPIILRLFLVFSMLLFSGYLIGYLVHRKKDVAPIGKSCALTVDELPPHETGAAPLMDWAEVKKLLAERVNPSSFDTVLR